MAKRNKKSTLELIRLKTNEIKEVENQLIKLKEELDILNKQKIEEEKAFIYKRMLEANLTVADVDRIINRITDSQKEKIGQ